MPSTYKILGQGSIYFAPNSNVTVYTVPAGKQAVVASIVFYTSGGGYSSLWVVKAGQSPSNSNELLRGAPAGTTTFKGLALSAGDSVVIGVGNANSNTTCNVFGAEIE